MTKGSTLVIDKHTSAGVGPSSLVFRHPSTGSISLAESLRIALDTLMANKLRTVLTALGVIIGVAAVVALLALGRGSQEQIAESITKNGANLLTVRAGSLSAGGFSGSGGKTQSLTLADAQALADPANVPDAALVSPEALGFGQIVAGARSTSAMVTGATETYLAVHNQALAQGQFIGAGQSNAAVLGGRVAATLFPDGDVVGRSIKINGKRFRVIGVLKLKGGDSFGSGDDGIIVPLATAQRELFGGRDAGTGKLSIGAIAVQARDEEHIASAAAQIKTTLRERHRLPASGAEDDFSVDNQQSLIDTLTQSRRTMTLYLGAIAAISLLVGGIGIMNIMLVSVRERTREIGLRKALGARERDILTQFLIEALALSTSGGVIGLLAGILIAVIANTTGQGRATVTPESAALALGFAMAIGLFFGIEPARRAARLDPIEALRYE
ncbi:MAG TPA: ABC transporter permease [Roseiflexaceae bacterium]|nr:ABC transporter permease [Roseiflexaceae bacterium]